MEFTSVMKYVHLRMVHFQLKRQSYSLIVRITEQVCLSIKCGAHIIVLAHETFLLL